MLSCDLQPEHSHVSSLRFFPKPQLRRVIGQERNVLGPGPRVDLGPETGVHRVFHAPPMHLMYYLDAEGKRVYTLKVGVRDNCLIAPCSHAVAPAPLQCAEERAQRGAHHIRPPRYAGSPCAAPPRIGGSLAHGPWSHGSPLFAGRQVLAGARHVQETLQDTPHAGPQATVLAGHRTPRAHPTSLLPRPFRSDPVRASAAPAWHCTPFTPCRTPCTPRTTLPRGTEEAPFPRATLCSKGRRESRAVAPVKLKAE